jgi:hypothetical protein
MDANAKNNLVKTALAKGNGILEISPAWVARTFLAGGMRLGLPAQAYDLGPRGTISERWLGATNTADNALGPKDEGLCYIMVDGKKTITLKEAVETAGAEIMGAEYAQSHAGLGRLAKIFDYADRLPYHLHQQKKDASLLGRNPKEEAYYFPAGVDLGPHAETYFGVHPWISEQKKYDVLLPFLKDWKDDLILQHSRAYKQVPGEGFHLPAGVPHAPGTAVTIELQEDSDVSAMLQALVHDQVISKEFLFKDITPQARAQSGESAILAQIDWEISGDPYFYENRHTPPLLVEETRQAGGEEFWIFYNTLKFSGKKLVVKPGQTFMSVDRGVYNILVWRGQGTYDGHAIEAGRFDLDTCHDELLISHARATTPIPVKNTGKDELEIIKFFGPDINPQAPLLPPYPAKK